MIKGGGSASLNGFFYQGLITIISSLTPAKDAESEWDTLCPEYKTVKDKADFAFKKNEEIIEVVQVKTSRTGKGFTPKNITNVIKDLVKDCSEAKKYTLKLITESTYSSSTLSFVSSINDKSYNNDTYLKKLINEKNISIELKEATKPELMSSAKELLKKYFIDTFEIENISDSKIELVLNSHFVEIMLASINQNNLSRNALNRKLYNQIFETPELKKLIFTSRNKVRKQLKQKPQFSDAEINEIKNYIPRNILKFENKRYSTENFLVWAKDNSSTTNVKILNGPSGYGKSGLLRMLYVNLLYDNKYPFIPCYYNLSSTYNHGDFKSVFNAKPDQKYKSIPDSWVYFIFDGLDNLSIKSLENLADDISELVTKDINARAKIILAGRPDEYNKDLFDEKEYEIAEIAPLTNDEKLQIFNKKIKDTSLDYKEQFINTRYNEDDLSIFDITAIIEFINSKKRFPSNKVDLYSFLLDKTITLLGRKQIANKEFNFASFLYITTGHQNPQYLLFDNRPQTSFLLSHKSIIEYSAACYIVNKYKTANEIINLFCYEDIISPHMKNTLTMVLSILSEKDMPLFKQTLNTLLISKFKAPTLLSIEPILLPQSVKENIINFFSAPEMIRNTQMQCRNKFAFFISQSMKCFEYLINIFFKKDNISEKIILLDLIQNTMYYKQAFQQDTYKTFKPLLLNLINTQGDSEIILRIIDLLLSCNTVKQCFSTTEIDSLTEFVNSKNSLKTVCGMHLCKILSSCPENISDKSFSVLEDCYFKILNWMLSQKSYQSTIETSSSQLFYYLGKTYFTLNISRFSCFLERYLSSIKCVKRRLPHHLPDKLILSILLEFESYNTDLVSLLLKISKQESKITFHNSDTMLDIICKAKSKKSDLLLCNMLNTYISEQKDAVQNIIFIQPAICRMFSSYETFTFFKEKLSEQAIQKICSSKYISPLYNTIMILNMGESIELFSKLEIAE